jgi:hypothetical protein
MLIGLLPAPVGSETLNHVASVPSGAAHRYGTRPAMEVHVSAHDPVVLAPLHRGGAKVNFRSALIVPISVPVCGVFTLRKNTQSCAISPKSARFVVMQILMTIRCAPWLLACCPSLAPDGRISVHVP